MQASTCHTLKLPTVDCRLITPCYTLELVAECWQLVADITSRNSAYTFCPSRRGRGRCGLSLDLIAPPALLLLARRRLLGFERLPCLRAQALRLMALR